MAEDDLETGAHADDGDDRVVEPAPTLTAEDLADKRGANRVRLVLLVVVVLVAGLLIGRLTSSSDDAASDDSSNTPGQPTGGDAVPFPQGDQSRLGYWGYASLEETVVDTFDRADSASTLGSTGTDQAWVPISGTWGIQENRARSTGGGQGPSMVVVPEGNGEGLVEVTLMTVEDGAGLVFRYQDEDNYWSVTANPGVGSWSLNRVIDGDEELVSEVPGPTNDGITVSTTSRGSVVRVLLDGEEYLNITDAALTGQLQGGLIAGPNSTGEARWDRFLVMQFTDSTAPATTAAG